MIVRSPLFLLSSFLLMSSGISCSASEDLDSIVKVGDTAPAFTVTTTEKSQISLRDLKGKVVLLNFFTTWCGPCRAEMPHLEREIWQPLKNRGLSVLAIAREAEPEEASNYKSGLKLSIPVCIDTDRSIYAKYASKTIPRNYVIDKSGKIIFASVGYQEPEFAKMKEIIEQALGGPSSSAPNPLQLALSDLSTEKYESAIVQLKAILLKSPTNAQAHYLLAVAYARTKQFTLADEEYRATAKHSEDKKLKELAELGLAKIHPGQK